MKRYALLGTSLSHSFSQQYFSEKFLKEKIKNTEYFNIELDNLNGLTKKITQLNLSGFNVTIPYKEEIIKQNFSLEKNGTKFLIAIPELTIL